MGVSFDGAEVLYGALHPLTHRSRFALCRLVLSALPSASTLFAGSRITASLLHCSLRHRGR